MKFQVQLKIGSNTTTQNVYADDYKDILDTFSLSSAEVLEIREFVYESDIKAKDDGDYIKSCTVSGMNEMGNMSLKIPKIKRSLSELELSSLIKNNILFRKKPLSSFKMKWIL
jgi:hypothetical protein